MNAPTPAPEPVPGAGGVVFDPQGRVLVLRHAGGDWVFPKGHLEPGESELAAALREVEEEAGVRARTPEPPIADATEYRNAGGTARRIRWFLLRCQTAPPLLREALFPEGAFLEPAEARRRLSFAQDRALLARMLERLPQSEVGA